MEYCGNKNLVANAASLYKVLANETRIKIMYCLRERHACQGWRVNEIVSETGYSQPTVSKQLAILTKYHLVSRKKDGNTIIYSLDDTHVTETLDATIQHLKHTGLDLPTNIFG